jgi:RNA polymerase sigma-70 factor (ECF subfamily)
MRTHAEGGAAGSARAAGCELPLDDRRALGALLKDLEPCLTALAIRFTRDRDTAQDVVQNAFEKAIRHGHRFRGDARVSTWLHRIVANEALMWLRSQARRAQAMREIDELCEEAIADPAPDVPETLARRELAWRVRAAIHELPTDQRDVLLGCVLAERTYDDFGHETGVHPASLKSRAFRARRRLGLALGQV